MERTFTPKDIHRYLLEIRQIESAASSKPVHNEPSSLIIQNILRYSSALSILKTQSVGKIYQLTN